MIRLEKYYTDYKDRWDQFIKYSKNGLFLFYRDYMEYHSDKFEDFSLMFFNGNKLIAVMPANIENDVVISHDGLTYGGIISDKNMKTKLMLEIFEALKEYLKSHGVKKLVYKPIPHIYHTIPAEEDLYALFRNDAKLVRRDVASSISMNQKMNFYKKFCKYIKKCKELGFEIKESHDFETFMAIVTSRLKKKYGVRPTHTAEEINLLANKFPNNIKLFTAELDDEIFSGAIMYANKTVAHVQYLAATDAGRNLRTNDFILYFLINNYYKDKNYFDYGISTEKNGLILNEGLIDYKEKFGSRAIVYDFYELII